MEVNNNMKAIYTEGLTKCYKEKRAVDSLNLSIEEGELFALLGVNGAGKTTTIRMLTCLSTPTSGTAQVLGHDVTAEADAVKRLGGISTQDTAVAENLTVYENLKFMDGIYRADCVSDKKDISGSGNPGDQRNKHETGNVPAGTPEERIEEIIEIFSLEEVRNKKAKTLSGGWKRKLSIAMALIGEPKILYLDEPTLGLDVLARRELWKIIEGLKGRITIILTTHYMEEAEALADRIAVMINGRIAEIGTLGELEAKTGKKGLEEVFVEIAERS